MRPIKLVISAFGPYAEKTVIEMDKLGKSGLFLIAGDTGAGKTTIFDAISYALFGQASGSSRNGQGNYAKHFRCLNATPDTPTFVELTFEYAGREYRVERKPEYDRPKQRGEGMTTVSSEANLYPMVDGNIVKERVVSGSNAVTKAVCELIGINAEQFSQIAMIAQGDFMDLLLASTDDRIEIFRKLFKTDKFELLQKALKKQAANLESQCGESESLAGAVVSRVSCDDNSPLAESVLGVKRLAAEKSVAHWAEVCDLFEKVVEEDSVTAESKKKELDDIAQRITALNQELGKARGLENARKSLAEVQKQQAELLPELDPLTAKLTEAESHKSEIDTLQEEVTTLKNLLPEYAQVHNTSLAIKSSENNLAKNRESLDSKKKDFDKRKDEIQKLEEELMGLSDAGGNKARLEGQKGNLETRKKQLKEAADLAVGLDAAEEAIRKAQDECIKAGKKYQQDNDEYEAKNRAFLNEQAGILAETLEEGSACPVCGSTAHPHKACKSVQAPTQQELETLKKRASDSLAVWNGKSEAASSAKAVRDAKRESFEKVLADLFGECTVEESKEKIRGEIDRVTAQLEETGRLLATETTREARKKELEENLPQLKETLERNRKVNDELVDKISRAEAELETQKKALVEMQAKLPYPEKSEAEKLILEKQKAVTKLQNDITQATAKLNECRENLKGFEGQVKSLEEQLKDAPQYNLVEMESECKAVSDTQRALTQSWKSVSARLEQNKSSLKELREISEKLNKLVEKRLWVKNLSDTANGDLSKKEKTKLEAYVQAAYLERILRKANMRFLRLSSGQYELVRRGQASDKRSQSGLDLNVYDHSCGKEREVKTLSGGESFLASLSLALGLADEVQSSAGGIELDTMFIDEGFGSLDDYVLKLAIDTLENLAGDNRLVGIISHVEALDQKIEKKLRVTKSLDKISRVTIEV